MGIRLLHWDQMPEFITHLQPPPPGPPPCPTREVKRAWDTSRDKRSKRDSRSGWGRRGDGSTPGHMAGGCCWASSPGERLRAQGHREHKEQTSAARAWPEHQSRPPTNTWLGFYVIAVEDQPVFPLPLKFIPSELHQLTVSVPQVLSRTLHLPCPVLSAQEEAGAH